MSNCWNTDFYSSHVIPLSKTISSHYFITWLLPSLFANAKVTHLYLATIHFDYYYDSKHVSDMVALKLPEHEFNGLLNNVREKLSMFTELMYLVQLLRISSCSNFSKHKPHTSKLKSISKYQLLTFLCTRLKNMVFYTSLWSRWNIIHVRCAVHHGWDHKCLDPAAALKYEPLIKQLHHSSFESWRYFNVMLLNTFSCNRRWQNCEEPKWQFKVPLFDLYHSNAMFRCQNLIGS